LPLPLLVMAIRYSCLVKECRCGMLNMIRISIFLILFLFSFPISAQTDTVEQSIDRTIHIVGAMSNVMHKGQLTATINLDTLSHKAHLYGVGPLENLAGEALLLDGHGYESKMINDSTMKVTETFSMKAPFFVYTQVDPWQEVEVPDSLSTLPELEKFLDEITQKYPRPFCFRLAALADTAVIHVVNLPKGKKVHSPEDAHQGQREFVLTNKTVEMVGFFSKEHQGVFTHHDSYVHIHLITFDKRLMGHLERFVLRPHSAILLLPTL
jgi:acetolactate decarboxylase